MRGLSTTSLAMESATMPSVTLKNMNPAIKKMEYAVRGPLVIRATAIEKELEKVGPKNLIAFRNLPRSPVASGMCLVLTMTNKKISNFFSNKVEKPHNGPSAFFVIQLCGSREIEYVVNGKWNYTKLKVE